MIASVITAVFLVQMAQPDSGPAPARGTLLIILKNGKEFPVFENVQDLGGSIRVELDTPWEPGTKMIKKTEIESNNPERPRDREKRIKEGWESRHFTEVNGRYFPTAEVQLAKRARELAGVTDAKPPVAAPTVAQALVPVESAAAVPKPSAPTSTPGFLGRYGAHTALIAIALLLGALIVRVLILRSD